MNQRCNQGNNDSDGGGGDLLKKLCKRVLDSDHYHLSYWIETQNIFLPDIQVRVQKDLFTLKKHCLEPQDSSQDGAHVNINVIKIFSCSRKIF